MMTIDRFRKNTGLVDWAIALMKSGEWAMLLEALESGHPRHYRAPALAINEPNSLVRLGRIEGYDDALNNMHSLAVLLKEEFVPEMKFEPPTTIGTV